MKKLKTMQVQKIPDGLQKSDSKDSEKHPADESDSDEKTGLADIAEISISDDKEPDSNSSHHSELAALSQDSFGRDSDSDADADADSDSDFCMRSNSDGDDRLSYDSSDPYYELNSDNELSSQDDDDSSADLSPSSSPPSLLSSPSPVSSPHSTSSDHSSVNAALHVSSIHCCPRYVTESAGKELCLTFWPLSSEYKTAPVIPLFLSIVTALSDYIAEEGSTALDQLFPLSPDTFFISTDHPTLSDFIKGSGVYIALEHNDEHELTNANRYLPPELDSDDPDSFSDQSAEEKEKTLVYSFGLAILYYMTQTVPLSSISDPKEAHKSFRDNPDPVINDLLRQCTAGELLMSLLQSMVSTNPKYRPTFAEVRDRLNNTVH